MSKQTYLKLSVLLIILLAVFSYLGCEQKTETKEEPKVEVKEESMPDDAPGMVDTLVVSEPVVEETVQIPDLKGSWTGTFDKRATTLKITEQTDSSFSGKISISYREAINQDVKGTISPSTMRMNMKDQLHSRYRGKYNGKLSEDGKSFSGTFTMDLDGKKYSFNLKKK